jgi:hypothetical protein
MEELAHGHAGWFWLSEGIWPLADDEPLKPLLASTSRARWRGWRRGCRGRRDVRRRGASEMLLREQGGPVANHLG